MNYINFININAEGEYEYTPKNTKKGVKASFKKEKGEYTPKKKKGHNGQQRKARMSFYEEF